MVLKKNILYILLSINLPAKISINFLELKTHFFDTNYKLRITAI